MPVKDTICLYFVCIHCKTDLNFKLFPLHEKKKQFDTKNNRNMSDRHPFTRVMIRYIYIYIYIYIQTEREGEGRDRHIDPTYKPVGEMINNS